MRRYIDEELASWAAAAHRKPLILFGARQVGKTYAITQFAKRAFGSVAYIDFSRDTRASAIFESSLSPADIVRNLELLLHMTIEPERTLIVFDEVQLCERALTSLKYFCDDAPQYRVIAAGSLLGVKVNRNQYSFPVGKVDMLTLHPMNFEEYLWACDETALADAIREACGTPDQPFALHNTAMTLLQEYLMVGGMPEAVRTFIAVRSSPHTAYETTRGIQRNIITAYIADMAKYTTARETQRIVEAWNSIPRQLARENHKFQYKAVRSGGRANAYQGALAWLVAAGIVNRLTRVDEPVAPLNMFADPAFFKIYLADTGLLTCAYDATVSDLMPADDKASVFRGAVSENYVLQQLVSRETHPYYWGTASKAEVEFIVRDAHGDIIPIEVKSGRHVTARSLTAYRAAYQPPYAVRLSAKNFGSEGGLRSIPLYAAWALGEQLR